MRAGNRQGHCARPSEKGICPEVGRLNIQITVGRVKSLAVVQIEALKLRKPYIRDGEIYRLDDGRAVEDVAGPRGAIAKKHRIPVESKSGRPGIKGEPQKARIVNVVEINRAR